jgi:hypothetical protein
MSSGKSKGTNKTKSWGIASFVLSILSLILCFAPYFGLPLAILAIVFYAKQRSKEPTGLATAGLVIGIIGIVVNVIMLLLVGFFFLTFRNFFSTQSTMTTDEAVKSTTCIENWQCGNWSICSSSGIQTRACTDSNNCETVYTKPSDRQICVPPGMGGLYFKGEPSIVSQGFGIYYIIGEILNNGTKSYSNYEIQIIADLYAGEKLVGTESGFPTANLPAGGTSSFEIMLYNPPAYDHYKLKISTY